MLWDLIYCSCKWWLFLKRLIFKFYLNVLASIATNSKLSFGIKFIYFTTIILKTFHSHCLLCISNIVLKVEFLYMFTNYQVVLHFVIYCIWFRIASVWKFIVLKLQCRKVWYLYRFSSFRKLFYIYIYYFVVHCSKKVCEYDRLFLRLFF